jgi:hypothetical protein
MMASLTSTGSAEHQALGCGMYICLSDLLLVRRLLEVIMHSLECNPSLPPWRDGKGERCPAYRSFHISPSDMWACFLSRLALRYIVRLVAGLVVMLVIVLW